MSVLYVGMNEDFKKCMCGKMGVCRYCIVKGVDCLKPLNVYPRIEQISYYIMENENQVSHGQENKL